MCLIGSKGGLKTPPPPNPLLQCICSISDLLVTMKLAKEAAKASADDHHMARTILRAWR